MVHQHFMLIPVMTVAENIVLAEEPTYAGVMLDFGEAREACPRALRPLRARRRPRRRIQDITVARSSASRS